MKNLSTFSREGIKKLLIRAPNWVGDGVMSLPAIEAIHRNFAQAEIKILAKPWVADLFRENEDGKAIFLYQSPGSHQGIRGRWKLGKEIQKEAIDLGILFPNSFDSALVFFLAGIPIRAGYNTDGRRIFLTHPVPVDAGLKKRHQVDYYLHLVRSLGMETFGSIPRLRPKASAKETALKKAAAMGLGSDQNWVGISPGAAYGSAKEWFPERYGELADRLAKRLDAQVLMLGSSREKEVGERVSRQAQIPIADLSGKTNLGEAMVLISRCRVFVTNDSGLMHVAAALGVPTVAIFGSTDPERTGPLGEACRVIQKPLPCAPCFKTQCPTGDRRCMDLIAVDEVFSVVEGLWPLGKNSRR